MSTEKGQPHETLHALLADLDDSRRFRFKKAVVEQAMKSIGQLFPETKDVEGHIGGVAVASDWLTDPSEENVRDAAIYAVAERIDGGVRYFDYPEFFLAPADAVSADTVEEAAEIAVEAAVEAVRYRQRLQGVKAPDPLDEEAAEAEREALQFQIRTALGLAGEQLLEKVSQSSIEPAATLAQVILDGDFSALGPLVDALAERGDEDAELLRVWFEQLNHAGGDR